MTHQAGFLTLVQTALIRGCEGSCMQLNRRQNMGGVIYAGTLTNFQSISFFPVVPLETKGFLTRQEAKSFLI